MGKRVRRREQAPKRGVRNEELGRAMIELRKGSRTSPHRDRSKFYRPASKWDDGGEW